MVHTVLAHRGIRSTSKHSPDNKKHDNNPITLFHEPLVHSKFHGSSSNLFSGIIHFFGSRACPAIRREQDFCPATRTEDARRRMWRTPWGGVLEGGGRDERGPKWIQRAITQTLITYFNRPARRYEPRATIVSENNKPPMSVLLTLLVNISPWALGCDPRPQN